jgi:hypothetical protein
MTDSNKTLIAALLDRSGSMDDSKELTEDGWRELINAQRSEPEYCEVTLAQFDTEYEVVYAARTLDCVPPLQIVPRGMTALLDAVGKTIVATGERYRSMPEAERPEKVLFVIIHLEHLRTLVVHIYLTHRFVKW